MRWYQHQTDAHRDTKIKKLINEFGADGYAVYFYCLELIAGDLDSDNITFELEDDAQLIGQYLKVDTLRVEAIMRKCLELKLFGMNERGRINCLKIAKFISPDYTRSPQLKKVIAYAKKNKLLLKNSDLSADSRQTVGRQSAVVSSTVPDRTVPHHTISDRTLNKELDYKDNRIKTSWERWKQYKKDEFKDSYKTISSEQIAINHLIKLCEGNYDNAAEIVDNAIANHYKGLFPINKNNNKKNVVKPAPEIDIDLSFVPMKQEDK